MTDEELDESRAQETLELVCKEPSPKCNSLRQLAIIAARLAREGWKPIDPLLLKVRNIAADEMERIGRFNYPEVRNGFEDSGIYVRIALAALKVKDDK